MDESHAIARLKQGDISGLENLVRAYQVRAARTAYLILRDRALAEDVTQTAFVQVFEHIGEFNDRLPFGPWFLRIVANAAIKVATRRERHVSLEPEGKNGIPFSDLLTDPSPGLSERVEQAEVRQSIALAIDQLAPAQRYAIVLRFYLGLKETEIANELDCPPGTVKSRLNAAREKLRKLLRPLQDPDAGRER